FFLLALAAASRSVFFRRDTRFLTLSLPWLFPITPQHSPFLGKFQVVSQYRGQIVPAPFRRPSRAPGPSGPSASRSLNPGERARSLLPKGDGRGRTVQNIDRR